MEQTSATVKDRAAPISIFCRDVAVRFFNGRRSVAAISGLTLDVAEGEFVSLLGASGCGKSTLLRVVAGLVKPSQGEIKVFGSAPEFARQRREIGFVFQDAALLPWRTALENVALPLDISGNNDREGTRRSEEMLALMGLSGWEHAYPHQLSGGMRQRVSIARALVSNPRMLLMDEPFGALDEITRDRLNEELRKIWKKMGVTILFVTHSIYEAAFLGQRVLMLAASPGRIRETVPVDLLEERTLSIRESREFTSLAAYLRRALEAC
jgi:NitT/TauT family transport system ATP-binding protein